MKASSALNTLTAILAVLLCIVFVISAFAAVIFGSISGTLSPEGFKKFVQNVDFTEIISSMNEGGVSADSDIPDSETTDIPSDEQSSDAAADENTVPETDGAADEFMSGVESEVIEDVVEQVAGELELGGEVIDDIIKSDFAGDLIAAMGDGIIAGLTGDTTHEVLSEDDIKDIFDENMDEVVGIVKEHVDENINEDELRAELDEFVDMTAGELSSAMNEMADMSEVINEDASKVFSFVLSGTLTLTLALIAAAALILTCVVRLRRFSGMFFAGIASVVATVFSGVLTIVLNVASNILVSGDADPALKYFLSIIGVLTGKLLTGVVLLAVGAVVLITASLLLRRFATKKEQNKECAAAQQ